MVFLALFLGFSAWQIPVRAVDVLYGPRLFPVAILLGLGLVAALIALQETRVFARSSVADIGSSEPRSALFPVGLILAGLLGFGLFVEPFGFIIAAALLFACVARAFDSKRSVRDALIGLVLASAIFALFSFGLGVALHKGAIFAQFRAF